jgi:hypothetical protein
MDTTSLWAFLRRHGNRLVLLPAGILIFLAGWQTGKVTSPYYAAHPIVFEERQCEEICTSSGGDSEELQALQEGGRVMAEAEKELSEQRVVPSTEPLSSVGNVAGTSTRERGQFVGSVNSDLYHAVGCPSVSRIKEENQIWFNSAEEAEAAGYSPSKCTQEKLAQ